MARKLKTYITTIGFFEQAVAAPSMKAAADALGIRLDAFKNGFASETDDQKIIAATMEKPGVVLKRGVGTKDAFSENPELPKSLPSAALQAPKDHARKPAVKKPARSSEKKEKGKSAAINSFQKESERLAKVRAKEEAALEKKRAKREAATKQARDAIDEARADHDEILASIEKERDALDRRAEKENARWEKQQEKLEADLDRAKR